MKASVNLTAELTHTKGLLGTLFRKNNEITTKVTQAIEESNTTEECLLEIADMLSTQEECLEELAALFSNVTEE